MKNVIDVRTMPTKCSKTMSSQFRQKENFSRLGNAMILKGSDIRNIKSHTDFKTSAQNKEVKLKLLAQREAARERAKQHRERLADIDKNRRTKENGLDMEMRKEQEAVKKELDRKMKDFRSENIDEVKKMNHFVFNAKCVQIRDKQLKQKKEIYEMEKNRIKKMDLMIEVERLKKVRDAARLVEGKREENLKGRMVIVKQIKDNHMKRMRQKEEQEDEAHEMLKRIKELENEGQRAAKMKLINQQKLKNLIDEANQAAIEYKALQQMKEREEDETRKQYMIQKHRQEEQIIVEKKKLQEEKEKEVSRLREKQEKANDRHQELDLLRARRAFQKGERDIRDRTKRDTEKQTILHEELNRERTWQMEQKIQRRGAEIKKDQELHQKTLKEINRDLARDRGIEEEKRRKRILHSEGIKKQIVFKSETEKQKLRDKEEERKRILKVYLLLLALKIIIEYNCFFKQKIYLNFDRFYLLNFSKKSLFCFY